MTLPEMTLEQYDSYDKIIISYSGGKDSTAMLLYLLQQGVDQTKIELWHQSIDGMNEWHTPFFDWPSTEGYVSQIADTLDLNLYWMWRDHGFYGEMFREDSKTQDIHWKFHQKYSYGQTVNHIPTKMGKKSTRRMWPAKTASLTNRWCSSYLKIDVGRRVLVDRFKEGKYLFCTGERRQESTARSKYAQFEIHASSSKKRIVHHYRPIIDWKEEEIWDIMKDECIVPHPAYYLGFPRLSCRSCIFFSNDHWATLNEIDPQSIKRIAEIEKELDFTLDNKLTINEMVQLGKSSITKDNAHWIKKAVARFTDNILVDDYKEWKLPSGAYGSGGGSI